MPQNHLKLQTNGRSSSIKKELSLDHFSVFPEVDLWLYFFFHVTFICWSIFETSLIPSQFS